MVQPYSQEQGQVIYQAPSQAVQTMFQFKSELCQAAAHCLNRPVRIHTVHGYVHDGVIVNIDDDHIYLQVSDAGNRQFYNPLYASTILPLVLYNLLVISLL